MNCSCFGCHRFLGDIQQNKIMAEIMEEAIEISHELVKCTICGRTFLPEPLKKHAKACEKNATRKRKTFNSLKQRIEGTDLAPFHQHSFLKRHTESSSSSNYIHQVPNPSGSSTHAATGGCLSSVIALNSSASGNSSGAVPPAPASSSTRFSKDRSQSKWKEKHEEFVQAIRAARGEAKVQITSHSQMAPRRSISAVGTMGTTERCPFCDRQFGPKAYDRHVEWCKEHKTRMVKSPANVLIAKERLEARTKYRVPPLNKSRRSITREKYMTSGPPSVASRNGSNSSLQSVNSTALDRSPSLKKKGTAPVAVANSNEPPLTEPVIKGKGLGTGDKSKSNPRFRKSNPKINDININETVLGMTVSHVIGFNHTPTFTFTENIDNNNNKNPHSSIKLKNSNENCGVQIPLTKNSKIISKSNNKLPLTVNIENSESEEDEKIRIIETPKIDTIHILSEIDNREFTPTPKAFKNEEIYNIKKDEIVTIKPVSLHTCDTDSMYSDVEVKTSDEGLNNFKSKSEFSSSSSLSFSNDIFKLDYKSLPQSKNKLKSYSPRKIWDQAEKEYLTSLKSKSLNCDLFASDARKSTTPILKKENCAEKQQQVDETNSSLFTTLRYEKYSSNNYLNKFSIETSQLISLSPRKNNPIIEKNKIEMEESKKNVTPNLKSPNSKTILNSPKSENESYIPLKVILSDKYRNTKEISTETTLYEGSKEELEKACNLEDLDNFLNIKSKECQLEIEIIATETSKFENNITDSNPSLHLFRANSSEIIVKGQNCLEAINHVLARNDIKKLNIVFVNEDARNERNAILNKNNSEEESNENIFYYEKPPKQKKPSKTKKKSYLKYVKKRKNVLYVPHDSRSKQEFIYLPFLPTPKIGKKSKHDNFWEHVAKSSTTAKENNKFNNSFESPLIIKKSILHKPQRASSASSYCHRVVPSLNLKECSSSSFYLFTPRITQKREFADFRDEERFSLPPIDNSNRSSAPKKGTNPFIVAEKQLMELLHSDDLIKSSPKNKTKSQKNDNNKVVPTLDDFQDNFEILENFINDNFVGEEENVHFNKISKSEKRENLCLGDIFMTDRNFNDTQGIDPRLINENDNLKIPEKLLLIVDDVDTDQYSVEYDKNISVLERRNDPIKRSISLQDDVEFQEFLSSFEDDENLLSLKSFLRSNSPDKLPNSPLIVSSGGIKNSSPKNSDKKSLSPLKRTVSLSNPVVKARSMKTKQDIQDYLHVRDKHPSKKETQKLKPISPKSSEELFPPDHEMYSEYKKYEEMYKREKSDLVPDHRHAMGDNILEIGYDSSNEDQIANERNRNLGNKLNNDSAYGRNKKPSYSLNRKSTKTTNTRPVHRHQAGQQHLHAGIERTANERSPSSSGSETSVSIPTKLNKHRISKFCHECGTKYPLDTAKFCVECGIKRLVL